MAINYNKAEFIRSAVRPDAFIRDGRPQVTFAGRSNVGKSSVINRLLNRKNFARVGATPGKTTQVNYFLIDNRVYLTDLPGYGYAKVSKEERDRWGRLMESYFQEPGLISLGVLIVDARHKPTADDVTMFQWFRGTGCPVVVVANKLDKLKKSEIEPNLQLIRDTLELEEQDCLVPFSAEKGTGKNELLSAISQRLGLPEEIIQAAAARVSAENVRFEDVLTKLDQQRQEMEKDRAEARRLKLEMEQSAGKAREYRKRLEEERSKVVEKAQSEARAIIQEARDASDLALSELKELKKRQDLDWQQVNDGRAEARRLLNEAERSIGGAAQEPEAPPPTRPARAGDTVELVSMGTRASVLSVNKDGTLQLQAGILKITAKQDEVRVVEGETQSQKEARKIIQRAERTLRTAAPREVDLRGMMTDEAIAVLDRFLDTAMMGKLESVTIIHGKGTGAVRKAVREHLKRSRYIKSFRPGRYGEGEDGVTVAELR